MKALALANRLSRDLNGNGLAELSATTRLEMLDAINGALQRLHDLAPHHSKQVTVSATIPAPVTVEISVEKGSTELSGYTFAGDDIYRTIRIQGDPIDNRLIGNTSLLHAYGGETSTVEATLYGDAIPIPAIYSEVMSNPQVLESGLFLYPFTDDERLHERRPVTRPKFWRVEAVAQNQNPPIAPSVMRFDSLPEKELRIHFKALMAPFRINFTDLLSPTADIPLRTEHIEAYLLPVARGILCDSKNARHATMRNDLKAAATEAEGRYQALVPQTLATPMNRARTRRGF
jgi:hypothetical protein